ncbi:MAG: hypothetical protein HS132_01720 [Planctomycetia bacterium]|nr:hypothetical protein [Planctomycetia bacterium]
MVYLREIIKQNKAKLIQYKNIEMVAYFYVSSPDELSINEFELSPEEEIALKGYKNESVENDKIVSIVSKAPIKGMSATSNIYKFSGLYLAAKEELKSVFNEKYLQGDLKQKYFLFKIEPAFKTQLLKDIVAFKSESIAILIKQILGSKDIQEAELDKALQNISKSEIDVQTQILLEDLEMVLLQTKYVNKTTEEVVRDVLNNFSNAIQKIIKDRRKEHPKYIIGDEYDVQDVVYVVLKSIFPNLRDEDPIPKVGAKSTKIDLILREEKILIEVKMIKEKDSNETRFIEQLKVDFESYHECKWLSKLFCFVYDPYKRQETCRILKDLNGDRKKVNTALMLS